MSQPPYSLSLAPSDVSFVSWDVKSPQREIFYQYGRGETKAAEALKGIKIDKFKNCFEQLEKVLIGLLHQMESTLKEMAV